MKQDEERKPGIPSRLESEILTKAGENWSVRKIAEWLETEHGVSVGYVTVSRFIAKQRSERAEVAKQVVRQKLSTTLVSDLDRLERIRADCEQRAAGAENDAKWAKLIELEVRVIDRKLHYAGVGPDTEAPPTIVLEWPEVMVHGTDADTAN